MKKLNSLHHQFFLAAIILIIAAKASAKFIDSHPSPYLQMHINDPVQWQSWGADVLEQAKKENKLIYMSIGYFSCHWCHVMQKESYSNPDIGKILNKHFIPVKVDRELRPELDRRMIAFVEAVRGQAGWPLNVFLTPDGYPVTGFTYLKKADFELVLTRLADQWSVNYQQFSQVAQQFFEQTESQATASELVTLPEEHFNKVIDAFVSQAMLIGDTLQGGFGETNKFPSYPQLNTLLKIIKLNPDIDSEVIDFVKLTLKSMSTLHLMDHVNFGFYRYVTDPDWQTPHFEKMLYDNAQLASVYFEAEKIWPNQGYADIGIKTLGFMQQYLSNGEGGFYASLSAVDENNIEGGHYYWSSQELKLLLDDKEYQLLKSLWKFNDTDHDIQSLPFNDSQQQQQLRLKLQSAPKTAMPVDTKSLASWNALALKAFVKGSEYSDSKHIKQQMTALYHYIINNFIDEETVHRFAGQQDTSETTLEDYAQLAHALQMYAQATDDEQAFTISNQLIEQALNRYFVNNRWLQNSESLIPGDKGAFIVQDAVLESPSSVLLQTIMSNPKASKTSKEKAKALIKRLTRDILDVPYHYGSAIMLRKIIKE